MKNKSDRDLLEYARSSSEMKKEAKLYGITEEEYYKHEFYNLSSAQAIRKAAKLQKQRDQRDRSFERLIEKTGLERKAIVADMNRINRENLFKINRIYYEKYELYKYDHQELQEVLFLLAERASLAEDLKADFRRIDQGALTYENIETSLKQFYEITKKLLPEAYKETLRGVLCASQPDIFQEHQLHESTVIDMEVTKVLLGFSYVEYICFHFWKRTIKEKRTYLSNIERIKILGEINDESGSDFLDDKRKTYEILGKYFHRKQILLSDKADIHTFKNFCKYKSVFVKKPVASSMGDGVEPVYINRKTDLNHLLATLLKENGFFVAEEMIKQHNRIKMLNPTSVNTVRLETYYAGGESKFVSALMRVGQNNSFVDNGGAGGITVSVDVATGIIESDGSDEKGRIYTKHPQTGIPFKGYQLPNWKGALALGKELSDKVPGVKYVGWDLAYTKKRKWVLVEGNSHPQFIGSQSSTGKGKRAEFIDAIQWQK